MLFLFWFVSLFLESCLDLFCLLAIINWKKKFFCMILMHDIIAQVVFITLLGHLPLRVLFMLVMRLILHVTFLLILFTIVPKSRCFVIADLEAINGQVLFKISLLRTSTKGGNSLLYITIWVDAWKWMLNCRSFNSLISGLLTVDCQDIGLIGVYLSCLLHEWYWQSVSCTMCNEKGGSEHPCLVLLTRYKI